MNRRVGYTSYHLRFIVWGLYLVFMLAIPFWAGNFVTHLIAVSGVWVMLTWAYNLLMGYTGLISIGQAAFFAIGGYTSAILVLKCHFPIYAGILCAVVVSSVFSLALGIPSIRTRGIYFALVTFGFGEVTRVVIEEWESLTGGPFGLPNVPPLFDSLTLSYHLILVLVTLEYLIIQSLVRSHVGRSFVSIRNERLAESVGIDTSHYKIVAFVVSSGFCGLGGALYVHLLGHAYSHLAGFAMTGNMLIYTVIGGAGTFWGPCVAAIFFTILPQFFYPARTYIPFIGAALLIIMLVCLPEGISGIFRAMNLRFARFRQTLEKTD